MENIISDINATLKTIEADINAIQATRPDTFTLQQLELLRQQLKLDLRQLEVISRQSSYVQQRYQETNKSLKEINNG